MKKLLAIPLFCAATVAAADEEAYQLQIDRIQDTATSLTTTKAAGSYAYVWNDRFTVQGDAATSKFSDSSGGDNSLGVQGTYQILDNVRFGGYLGWETFSHAPQNFMNHGLQFDIQTDQGALSLFAGYNGNDSFPQRDNTEYGATIRVNATDQLTLIGRGLMRDNDALNLFTTVVGAGADYDLDNGVTLNGELVYWDRKLNWAVYDEGLSISLGAKMSVGRDGILFAQRNSITNTFGSTFKYP